MNPEFDGSTAIITGAASGIGRETASALSDRGAYVVGLDRQSDPTDQGPVFAEAVSNGELVLGDVTNEDDVREAIELADEQGPISVVVNNAGISALGVPIEDVEPEDWQRAFAVHVNGTYNVCRYTLPIMREREAGAVINISSQFGLRGYHSRPEYAAAKGAITNLTRQLAVDYSPHGIRVNAVAPGFIRTGMTADTWRGEGDRTSLETIRERTLLPDLGDPIDVANVIIFLASELASHITGQIISVDGGWTAW
jgi:NAD(P)-dependent dehydrogenase (short-subunit alcohol dehydrogenase family)